MAQRCGGCTVDACELLHCSFSSRNTYLVEKAIAGYLGAGQTMKIERRWRSRDLKFAAFGDYETLGRGIT